MKFNICLYLLFCVLCAVLVGCAPAKKANPESLPEAEAAGDMRMLFDGQSFEGWEGVNAFFRIENEAIVAGTTTQPIPQNEFLCSIDRFSDFRLELETRLVGDETNAGIQFHTERIPGDNEVIGYQADIGAGYWGGIYDESRRNKMLVTADEALIDEILKPGAWNTYLLEAKGPNFRIAINGVQTVAYTEEDPDIPLEGHICLQIHSGPPGEQWYKSIALETL